MTKIDYGKIKNRHIFKYDVCIIGAGLAGVIAANEIKEKYPNLKICIVESGNFKLENDHNFLLKETTFTDLPIKKSSREFTIGGASSTWGGLTSHFNKDEVQNWPIEYLVLKDCYKKASEKYAFIHTLNKNDSSSLFQDFDKKPFFAYINPINYKKYIKEEFDLIYNSHVLIINSKKDLIEKIYISNSKSLIKSEIQADHFILASGSLEIIKILKNSLKAKKLFLGEEKKFLGKYFMNHPRFISGELCFNSNQIKIFSESIKGNIFNYFGISLSLEERTKEGLLNPYVRFIPKYEWEDDYLVELSLNLIKRLKILTKGFFLLFKKKVINDLKVVDYQATQIKNNKNISIRSLYYLIIYFFSKIKRNYLKPYKYFVMSYLEMEPSIKNMVYLGEKKDIFGNLNLNIDYSVSPKDKISLIRLHEKLDEYFSKNSDSRFIYDLSLDDKWSLHYDTSHHIGGTVMGSSPKNSFVDKYLRVHSLKNLHLISSSVFPTSGSHNPTYTIAALSIYMVNKIKL